MIHKAFRFPLPLALLLAHQAWAEPVRDGPVEGELLAEMQTIQAGQPFTVGVSLRMEPHWHTYWQYAGDAGLPTTIEWDLPEGFRAGPIQWPYPEAIVVEGLVNLGYENTVLLPVTITPPDQLDPGTKVPLKARVDWLVCKEACMPGGVDLSFTVEVGADTPKPDTRLATAFAATRAAQPLVTTDWEITAYRTDKHIGLEVRPPASWSKILSPPAFYPHAYGTIVLGAESTWQKQEDGSYVLTLLADPNAEAPATKLEGILISEEGWTASGDRKALAIDVPIAEKASNAAASSPTRPISALVLGLAFLGGLILNLMPCVFPVLALKVMSFVNQAGEERKKITIHGLVFTLGVMLSFWILSGALIFLRATGEELGWGFQLQSPAFVFSLAVVLLLFALNLSGLFEIGTSLTAVGGGLTAKSGYSGSFFTGILATVMATPCAAPMLAPALGVALTLPPAQSLLVFSMVGLGLSTPYLLLSAFPGLVALLPRPGAWMETFKEGMAFLLYATVAYLVWVLGGQLEEKGFLLLLLALVVLSLGGWVYGRWCAPGKRTTVRRVGRIAALLIVAAGLVIGFRAQRPSELHWEAWSAERLTQLREEGRPVLVDFTARWCATCQVNKAVIYSDAVKQELLDRDIALLKADWTNRDPAITRALADFGRSAVPVNAYYAPGAEDPVFLPELLTAGAVLEAIAHE